MYSKIDRKQLKNSLYTWLIAFVTVSLLRILDYLKELKHAHDPVLTDLFNYGFLNTFRPTSKTKTHAVIQKMAKAMFYYRWSYPLETVFVFLLDRGLLFFTEQKEQKTHFGEKLSTYCKEFTLQVNRLLKPLLFKQNQLFSKNDRFCVIFAENRSKMVFFKQDSIFT